MRALSACLIATSAVLGCSTQYAPVDANWSAPDAQYDDARIVFPDATRGPDACTATRRVMDATLGAPTTLMFDTTMTETRPRDLGLGCGNRNAAMWARQEIVEYRVPGTGPVGIEFTTVLTSTPRAFNTLVQVRRTCGTIPTASFPPSCFDDTSSMEARASGGVQAMGGETLFFVVTGHSEPETAGQVDVGPLGIRITAAANAAPTIATGTVRLVGDDTRVRVTGMDPESNVRGIAMGLYTASGQVDLDGDGMRTEADVLVFPFDSVSPGTDWTGSLQISGSQIRLAAFCRANRCTEASLVAYDAAFARSAAVRVPVSEAMIVGLGATCGEEAICAAGLVCGAGSTCEATPQATAACDAAMTLAIPTPEGTATTGSLTGMLAAGGVGVFGAPTGCASESSATDGQERIVRIDVPAGTFDLTVTTQRPGTGSTDTVLYLRSTCADGSSSLGCQDDISGSVLSSRVEARNVTEGDYYAVVESFGARGGAFELQATLRPVLAAGATCDPSGMQNRCASGTCPAAGMCP